MLGRMRVTRWVAVFAMLTSTGCGGEDDDFASTPVDVSGVYSVSVTNKSNACNLPTWEQDKQTSGIPITVTQGGTTINGSIDGVAGALVKFWLGSSTFAGSVDGDRVNATNFGTQPYSKASCTYTINMVMEATLTGDALQGVLRYTPKTNGSPDCGVLESCETIQEFAGSRPPK
jgi:hypothetical protein